MTGSRATTPTSSAPARSRGEARVLEAGRGAPDGTMVADVRDAVRALPYRGPPHSAREDLASGQAAPGDETPPEQAAPDIQEHDVEFFVRHVAPEVGHGVWLVVATQR